jgi:hypothetical protein
MRSEEEIKEAVEENRAVIRWSHGNWRNVGRLLIFDSPEVASMEAERDTRGSCFSMVEEVWSELATDVDRALRADRGLLTTS